MKIHIYMNGLPHAHSHIIEFDEPKTFQVMQITMYFYEQTKHKTKVWSTWKKEYKGKFRGKWKGDSRYM